MSRRLKTLLAVLVVLGVVVTAAGAFALWALPDFVRRVVVTKIPELTGRAARIEDVDLNLFTGRFAVKGIRLAERDEREAFVEISLVEGRVWLPALFLADIRLLDLRVSGVSARVVRTGPAEFNFSDLLALFKVDPAAKPSRWTFTIDRLALEGSRVFAEDRAVSPAANWSIDRLQGAATGITKRSGSGPGRADLRMKLGGIDVEVVAEDVRLAPTSFGGRIAMKGLDLARLRPYVPATVPLVAESGTVGLALTIAWTREPGQVDVARVSGDVTVEGLGVSQLGRDAPFLRVPRLALRIHEADAVARRVTVGNLEIDGLDLKAARDREGRIDLLEPIEALRAKGEAPDRSAPATPPAAVPAPPAAGPAAPAPPARGEPAPAWQVRVERLGIRSATVTVTDAMVSPPVDWRVEGLRVDAAGLDTSSTGAGGTVALATELLASSAPGMRTQVTVDASAIRLVPPAASGRVAIKAFDQASSLPYVPPGMPLAVTAGVLDAEAEVAVRPPAAAAGPGAGAPASPADAPAAVDMPAAIVEVPRFSLRSDRFILEDRTQSPPRQWQLDRMRVRGSGLSNSPDEPPAAVTFRARLGPPGAASPATLRVDADALRVLRRASRVRAALSGFDLTWLEPYVPPSVLTVPSAGALTVNLDARTGRGRSGAQRARASGTAVLTDVGVARRGESAPFLSVPRITVALKRADPIGRTLDVSGVELGGLKVRATRSADGRIDLLELRAPEVGGASSVPVVVVPAEAAGGASAPLPGPGSASAPWKVNVDRLRMSGGTAEFMDLQVSPNTTLVLTNMDVEALQFTWPPSAPTTITASVGMPQGGTTEVQLTGVLAPLDIQIRSVTRDAPIEPYQAYFPFPARFKARFNGDSLNEVKQEGDVLRAASRGTGWATDIEIEDPEAARPVLRMERMEIRGIDFSWPNYALVEKVTFTRPDLGVERSADGVINLRRLFTPAGQTERAEEPVAATAPPAGPPLAPAAGAPAGEGGEPQRKPTLLETIVLDFAEIALEEGHLRFLDRTTTPAFSEEMSRVALTVRGLSNVFGRQQTAMTMTATIGNDAALDLRGELSGIGETLRADLVGEIRDFDLAVANPYADSLTSWIVERGKLAAKIHYRIEGDKLTAEHDVNFGGLKVAKGKGDDEAKKRLGLPLGLIVGLMKDTRGNIDFDLPLTGTISDRQFSWGETMWAAAKQGILKVLVGPFRAIGRLFSGGGGEDDRAADLKVEPVTFSPGSAVVAPEMEQHLGRVAGFLRRSPFVGLSMVPVATAPDVESLRSQALNARILRFQEEKKLADFARAVRAYYRTQKIEGPTPKTTEEQLAILLRREPTPDADAVRALMDRRLDATREALSRLEGIPADRLVAGAPRPEPGETAEGRVEFSLLSD